MPRGPSYLVNPYLSDIIERLSKGCVRGHNLHTLRSCSVVALKVCQKTVPVGLQLLWHFIIYMSASQKNEILYMTTIKLHWQTQNTVGLIQQRTQYMLCCTNIDRDYVTMEDTLHKSNIINFLNYTMVMITSEVFFFPVSLCAILVLATLLNQFLYTLVPLQIDTFFRYS